MTPASLLATVSFRALFAGSGSAPISVLVLDGHDAGLCDEPMNKPLVLLLTFGTGGDLQPFLALAAGLQRRGHRTLLGAGNVLPAARADVPACTTNWPDSGQGGG